jgi:hypothetical protein
LSPRNLLFGQRVRKTQTAHQIAQQRDSSLWVMALAMTKKTGAQRHTARGALSASSDVARATQTIAPATEFNTARFIAITTLPKT